eukprot:8426933-Prorocentrum_lima.AAC.1
MTSSLVGSEMCIRDRLNPRRDVERLEGRYRVDRVFTLVRRPLRGCLVEPVSYTHLTLPTICSV